MNQETTANYVHVHEHTMPIPTEDKYVKLIKNNDCIDIKWKGISRTEVLGILTRAIDGIKLELAAKSEAQRKAEKEQKDFIAQEPKYKVYSATYDLNFWGKKELTKKERSLLAFYMYCDLLDLRKKRIKV